MKTKLEIRRFDFLSLLIFLVLLSIGSLMIYSIAYSDGKPPSLMDLEGILGKHFLFCLLSIVFGVIFYFVSIRFIIRHSYVIYGLSLLFLIGLFLFGKSISGAKSWYDLGFFSFQPSEFVKITTSVLIANIMYQSQIIILHRKIWWIIAVILLPVGLIFVQPDPGTAITFFFLIFMFFREGLPIYILFVVMSAIIIFILALVLGPIKLSIAILLLGYLSLFITTWWNGKTLRRVVLFSTIISIVFTFASTFAFQNFIQEYHRDRFEVLLNIREDNRDIGYHVFQSKIALGAGQFYGTGLLRGTQTNGKFVPEQHNDYIFSAVGEQWGFIGGFIVIGLYLFLILRIISKAEKTTNKFHRVYMYCFSSFLFGHFFINIGMTIGLLPTIGIPLPYLSYGGSNLLTFTILLSLYLSMDYRRLAIE